MLEGNASRLEKDVFKFEFFFYRRLDSEAFRVAVANVEPAGDQDVCEHVDLVLVNFRLSAEVIRPSRPNYEQFEKGSDGKGNLLHIV